MNGEFPEPESEFYVLETFPLRGGGSVTNFAAGPFRDPDEARRSRAFILEECPSRNVHCAEHRSCE